MLRLYTFLIISAILAVAVLGGIFGFDRMYRSEKVFLVVTQFDVPQSAHMIKNIAHIVDIYTHENFYDVRIKMESHKGSDVFSLITIGHGTRDIQRAESEITRVLEKRLQEYYGDNVALHVLSYDRVPHERMITMAIPYIVMLCVAVALIASVLAFFHVFDRMREDRSGEMAHVDGKKIFEKFHIQNRITDIETASAVEKKEEHFSQEYVNNGQESVQNEVASETMTDADASSVQIDHSPEVNTAVEASMPDGLQTIPGNLPVVDVSKLGFSKRHQKESDNNDDRKNDTVVTEPTEEELKARLNELLNGKL